MSAAKLKATPREPAIRAIAAPNSWSDWPDERVKCGDCGHRSRDRCIALKTWAHLPQLLHWCKSFTPQGRR